MKKFSKHSIATVSLLSLVLGLSGPIDVFAAGPAPVDLLSASNFAILSKTGITNTGSHTSMITGKIASSPITAAGMNTIFCSEITGTIYGVDAAYVGSGNQACFLGNPGVPAVVPPDANKTLADNAILDMGTAYADAAGKTNPTSTELGAGNIGGMTLAPGLYRWSTDLNIPTDVTLSGGADDVWIFQVAGNLDIASAGSVPSGIKVVLSGGAKASNVFWQVGGVTGATLGTYSTFNGNILSAKQIIMKTGAVLNGRALAQTQVTLDANVVSAPAVVVPPVVVPAVVVPPVVITPVTVPPVVITPVTTPSDSIGNNSGTTFTTPIPTVTVTNIPPALSAIEYRAVIRTANKNLLADIKVARAAFNVEMKKAITDKSITGKRAARRAFMASLKATRKAFTDAKAAARGALKKV